MPSRSGVELVVVTWSARIGCQDTTASVEYLQVRWQKHQAYLVAASATMLHILLLFAATSALSCPPKSIWDLKATAAGSTYVIVEWTAPPNNHMSCVGGYKVSLVPRNAKEHTDMQNSSMNKYTVKNRSSRHIATTVGVNVQATTGVPENMSITNCTSNSLDQAEGNSSDELICKHVVRVEIVTVLRTIKFNNATQREQGRTDHLANNIGSCKMYNISVRYEEAENINGGYTTGYTIPEGETIFNGVAVQESTPSSMMVSWNTSLSSNECVAAYTVCWKKQDAASLDCRNTTSDEDNLQITNLTENTKYQVSLTALFKTGSAYDNVTLEALTKSGAGGIYHNSLTGISTMICLLTFFI